MTDLPLSRRTFCAVAGTVAAGAAAGSVFGLSGCSTSSSDSSQLSVDNMSWWQKTIAYEAYPKSFKDTVTQGTGTLAGVTQKLDHLQSLGVGALWLTPVYDSPMVDNGYDVADYYAIGESYGTIEDMDTLIAQADSRDIKIVMDLVFNHTSDQCEWFLESRTSRDNDKADWYIWRDAAEDGGVPNNWRAIFGGSAWEWCEERQQYYLHTFAVEQPDLNWENERVRQALYDVANYWADKGAGGFRVDAITYIKKPSSFDSGEPDADDGMCRIHDATANTEGILDFLHEFKQNVREGRDIFMVGEANGVSADELGNWVGENGVFDMLFEFSHTDVPSGGTEQYYLAPSNWKLTDVKAAFTASQANTATNGWYPMFFENHDQPRSVNNFIPGEAYDTDEAAKMLAAVLLTQRGTPFIYQGEELGFTNAEWDSIDSFNDLNALNQYQVALDAGLSEQEAFEAVCRRSRDNARTPMQWDSSANAGFSEATPWLPVHRDYVTCNADAQSSDDASVLSWYRMLAAMRTENEVFLIGDYSEVLADSEQVYGFTRMAGDVTALTLANFSNDEVTYDADLANGMRVLASSKGETSMGTLQPLEAVVFISA